MGVDSSCQPGFFLLGFFSCSRPAVAAVERERGRILGIDRAARTLLYCITVFLLYREASAHCPVLGFRSGKRIANMLAVCPAGICHGGAESARDTLLQHFQLISERSHMGWIWFPANCLAIFLRVQCETPTYYTDMIFVTSSTSSASVKYFWSR